MSAISNGRVCLQVHAAIQAEDLSALHALSKRGSKNVGSKKALRVVRTFLQQASAAAEGNMTVCANSKCAAVQSDAKFLKCGGCKSVVYCSQASGCQKV